jgi:hypothetical protein
MGELMLIGDVKFITCRLFGPPPFASRASVAHRAEVQPAQSYDLDSTVGPYVYDKPFFKSYVQHAERTAMVEVSTSRSTTRGTGHRGAKQCSPPTLMKFRLAAAFSSP